MSKACFLFTCHIFIKFLLCGGFYGKKKKKKNKALLITLSFLLVIGIGLAAIVGLTMMESNPQTNNCQHEWLWGSTTTTCTTDGYTVYKCSKCNKTKQENESAYGCYDYDNDGYCNVCLNYLGTNTSESAYYISNRSISYIDKDNCYRFCFALMDIDENYISCNANIEISIVNDLGETVYQGTKYVTSADYGEWYNVYEEWIGTAVYINISDIKAGLCDEGIFYYKVVTNDNWFEYSLNIYDLPTYTPTFSIGEKWSVNGEWELTILSIDTHNDCELNTEYETYALITYQYKNIGNTKSPGFNFNGYNFNVYDDKNGNLGNLCSCWKHTKSADNVDMGATTTASVLFGFTSNTQSIKIVASNYDSNYNSIKANFIGNISTCKHSYSNGNCDELAHCDTCGATTGEILGHDYSEATCTQVAKCTRCGKTKGTVAEHSYLDATCITAKKCDICGHTEGEALGHEYNIRDYGHCSRCGEERPNYFLVCSLGDTFIYEDSSSKFEIAIGNTASIIEVTSALHNDKYCPTGYAVKIPITITNIGTSTAHLYYPSDYKLFTSDGAEVLSLSSFQYVYDDCLDNSDIRPNGTVTRYFYFNYTGNGEYVVEFDDTALNQVTIIVEASKCEHVGDEGVCTKCGKVTDAKLALACYIIKNGTKLSSGNSYVIYKTINQEGKKITGYIEFDYDNLEFTFSMDTNTDCFTTMKLVLGNNLQKTEMTYKYSGYTYYACGNIYANTFSATNPYIYNFDCSGYGSANVSSSLKSLLGTSTAGMLVMCEQMLQETKLGVTMAMFGFSNLY